MRRISTLVRLFDLRLASNRFVLAAFAAAAVGVAVSRAVAGEPAGAAASLGIQFAFAVLLSWAIARELDPDRPASATIAAVAGFLISFIGPTNLGAVTALLFAVRIVARSGGAPPSLLDLLWLPGLAAYSARSTGGFLAGVALGGALAWDAREARGPVQWASAALAAGLAIALAIARGTLAPEPAEPGPWDWVVLAAAAVALPALRLPPAISVGDISGERLSHRRLVLGRSLAVAVGAASVAWLGGGAAASLVGLWAGVIGIALARGARATRARFASSRAPGTVRTPR